jgi:hypothetical protein
MKNFTILLLLVSINCFSQIEIEKPESTKILKPVFDEKIDLNEYKTAEQFLGLIGKELFYLPENSKYDFFLDKYNSISYIPKRKFKLNKVRYKPNQLINLNKRNKELFEFLNIKGNFFVVDSINFSETISRNKINGIEFNELKKKYSIGSSLSGCADIYTHHKSSNEIIIFDISGNSYYEELIPVAYFDYLKKKYLDKKIIISKSDIQTLKRIISKPDIHITIKESFQEKLNDVFTNIDSSKIFQVNKITLKEPKGDYPPYYIPVFNLKNLNNTLKEIEFRYIKNKLILYDNEFIFKKDSLEKIKIAKSKLKQEQKELQKVNIENKRIERYNKLMKKYGKNFAETIINNKVSIGMTKEMCRDSWGAPNSINKTTNAYGYSEQWVYGDGYYLYFDNGKLTTIQN